mmetsp:Transcript_15612/g.28219  ORF Transcript_15612/g.28219 Transcript_15612/m.28219 type:complete len:218 (+) Transcript_15612:100-753(+)
MRFFPSLNLSFGKFLSHGINGLFVSFNGARFLQDGTSCNHHVNTGLSNLPNVVDLDTSINLQTTINASFLNKFPCLTCLFQSGRNESLPTESRVYTHKENDIKLIHHKLGCIKRSSGVKDKSSLAPSTLDKLKGAINVVGRLRVEGNVRSTSINKITNGGINWRNHEMNIDRGGNTMVSKSLAYHGTNSQVGHIMVVHDIKVNDIGTGFQHVINFFA